MIKIESIIDTLKIWIKHKDTNIIINDDLISIKRPQLQSIDIFIEKKLYGLIKNYFIRLEAIDKIKIDKETYNIIKQLIIKNI